MAPSPPLVSLNDARLIVGGATLFDGLAMAIGKGDRLCLVGRNGSGKSSLMRVLAGSLPLDSGAAFVQPGITVAYLGQEPSFGDAAIVRDHVCKGLPADGMGPEDHRIESILDAVGSDGDADPTTLSGGESRRADLARVLVGEPDVLLLDEPTNHLDLPTIEWLEQRLIDHRGALMVVSHDRAFLTRVGNGMVWLDRGQARQVRQGFETFETWRDTVYEDEAVAAEKLDKKIKEETRWLREGLTARRRRNMGRVRALEQMRADRSARTRSGQQVEMTVAEAARGGTMVIEADGIGKRYGDRSIIDSFSTRILRGDRLGVIGPNGAGKSTLVKMLVGALVPDHGTVKLGTTLEVAYFDQRRDALDPSKTLKETLAGDGDTVLVGGKPRHIAGYLKDFLFDPSRLLQPVSSLSGGERNRLLLARLFARPSNLLVLDEPTNDLDLDTLDLLVDVLADYAGTLILVSHDRDFIDRLVTSLIAVEGDGTAQEYVGGFTDYHAQRRPRPEAPRPTKAAAKPQTQSAPKARAVNKLSYKETRALDQLPKTIAALEAEIAKLETVLADGTLFTRDPAAFSAGTARLEVARTELETAEDEWLTLEMKREELQSRG